VADIHVKYQVS